MIHTVRKAIKKGLKLKCAETLPKTEKQPIWKPRTENGYLSETEKRRKKNENWKTVIFLGIFFLQFFIFFLQTLRFSSISTKTYNDYNDAGLKPKLQVHQGS